ncbi:YtxH domain-containing protein [Paenibacillus campi]|uniref:YtxH domain-containing protein n=1 Tax=Paenibacillus campi TaxID=3106031 RepID=UPI002AFDD64D|nr:YtxH domain-containing protein [Paenibacillus sp. SGZ-1014]
MDQQQSQFVYGLIAGAFIGAAAAALFTPKSGRDMRADLMYGAEMIKEKGPEWNEKGHEVTEKGREVVAVVKESIGVAREWKEQVEAAAEDVKQELAEFKEQQDAEKQDDVKVVSKTDTPAGAASVSAAAASSNQKPTTPPAGKDKTSNYSV